MAASDLKKQFPDLSQSVCVGILDATGGDKAAAEALLQGMSTSAAQSDRNRKIQDLEATFKEQGINLSRDDLVAILERAGWDVENALVIAFEHIQTEERRRREQARKEEAQRVAKNWLQQMFATVPQEKIQQILEENEGDVEVATEQLLAFVAARELSEKEAKEKAERDRQLLVEALTEKLISHFITEPEIVRALQECNWDSETALQKLLQLSEQKKLHHIANMFKSFSADAIQQALVETAWDPVHAAKTLTNARHKRQKEEEEKRAIAAAATLQVASAPAPAPAPAPEPAPAPAPAPAPISSPAASVQAEKKAEDWKTQSIIMNKEIREMIHQQQEREKKQQHEIIKAELEMKLRLNPSDVPGPLGLVPLTPKIIDEQMRKLLDTEEEKQEKKATPVASGILPAEVSSAPAAPQSNETLKFQASPDRVETGETITVEWTSEQPLSSTDWIGILPAGSPANTKPDYWYWVPNVDRKGSITFTAPSSFGDYEFRFYSNRSYNVRAVSNVVSVGPVITMAVESSSADNKFPKTATVSFQRVFGRDRTASWIAMYPKSQQDNYAWITYQWVTYGANQKANFEVPKAGEWEFRFFPEKAKPFVSVASVSLLIQGNDVLNLTHQPEQNKITVKCSVETVDPASENAWVGIYHTNETNQRQYRRYKYISSRDAEVTFKALQHSGTYEARIYVGNTVVARSNPITLVV